MIIHKIRFQNKKFPLREIEINGIGTVYLSTVSLNENLLDNKGKYVSDEAIKVDEGIFYFVSDEEISLSDKKLKRIVSLETL